LSYISPLLEFAERHIPADKWSETPLYILATAGMRLLDKDKQEAIIRNLRQGIRGKFKFLFPEGNLEVITGKQEGEFATIAWKSEK
jgi:Golgi nucleoside diphosphatase